MWMTWPVELLIATISGLTEAVAVVLEVNDVAVTGVTSMPSSIFPLLVGVNNEEFIVKGIVETCPAALIEPGMMANVLPCPALITMRSSRNSGARSLRRRTRGIAFDVSICPPWPVVNREK